MAGKLLFSSNGSGGFLSGSKARVHFAVFTARLKSCPDAQDMISGFVEPTLGAKNKDAPRVGHPAGQEAHRTADREVGAT